MTYLKSLIRRVIPKLNSIISNSFGDRYLLCTNVGLSFALSGLGDIIQQYYEILIHQEETWDRIRTRNMSIFGMTIGIFCHHWYNYLDRRLPGYTIQTVMKKIVVDQLVCSPVCIGTLFVTAAVLERSSTTEMVNEMKHKGWKLYAAEWAVWPPAQFINFYFLPTKYRVLYDNTISLGYDVYTSYVKHSKSSEEGS